MPSLTDRPGCSIYRLAEFPSFRYQLSKSTKVRVCASRQQTSFKTSIVIFLRRGKEDACNVFYVAMAALRRPKYLTCFYCGKRTSTRYDGRVRRFECPSCDATNYLDEVSANPYCSFIDVLTGRIEWRDYGSASRDIDAGLEASAVCGCEDGVSKIIDTVARYLLRDLPKEPAPFYCFFSSILPGGYRPS